MGLTYPRAVAIIVAVGLLAWWLVTYGTPLDG
jgi:hypothetical protein